MFYSQFILAKKGPLGTIWIAAHLERKLRKNQVADTDIGVSVDSILSPDVPIALRLSSHLLLGVVRIYSKKVNYLFDDCSDALLKVKQAFRSTAVDLPPEQSKAPYHSITLPETFDLDDFEIPDDEIYQGNFVDHHVSAREQITLQDNLEGVAFSTSRFGPDERFGDGDASQIGLDLDEDMFLDKNEAAGTSGVSMDMDVDPPAPVEASSPVKDGDHNESGIDPSVAASANNSSIQGPSTPGLIEEPNLPTAQALVSDDHMDEDHSPSEYAAKEVCGPSNHQELPHFSNHDFYADGSCYHKDEEKARSLEVEFSVETMEIFTTSKTQALVSDEHVEATNGPDSVGNAADCYPVENESNMAVDIPLEGHSNKVFTPLPDIASGTEVRSENSDKNVAHSLMSETKSENMPSFGYEVPNFEKTDLNIVKSVSEPHNECEAHPSIEISETNSENIPPAGSEVPNLGETDLNIINSASECQNEGEPYPIVEISDTFGSNIQRKLSAPTMPVLQNCNSHIQNALTEVDGTSNFPVDYSTNVSSISTDVQDSMKINLGTGHPTNQVTDENGCETSNLPAIEKMLSMPNLPPGGQHDDLFVESTPIQESIVDADKVVSGRKRSYTESTLTVRSLNSVEYLGAAQSKQSGELVPEDDDLLSSILVGRRSTTLKMKPTPPVADATSTKRQRVAVRTTAQKRKVLVDDATVLHGDMIRQQLTSTEDIRRARMKAPCTRLEIWMVQKQFLEDEIFAEPVFAGMSANLVSLHYETFDLGRIKVFEDIKGTDKAVTSAMVTLGQEAECASSVVPSDANAGTQNLEGSFEVPSNLDGEIRNDSENIVPSTTSNDGDQYHRESLEVPSNEISTLDLDGSSLQKEVKTLDSEVSNEGSQCQASETKVEMETENGRVLLGCEATGADLAAAAGLVSEVNRNLEADDIANSSHLNETGDVDSVCIDSSCQLEDDRCEINFTKGDTSTAEDGVLTTKGLDFDRNSDAECLVEGASGVDKVVTSVDIQDRSLFFEDGNVSVPFEGEAHPTSDRTIEECQLGLSVHMENCSLPVDDEFLASDQRDNGGAHTPWNLVECWDDDPKMAGDPTTAHMDHIYGGDHADYGREAAEQNTDFLNVDDDDVAEDYEGDVPNSDEKPILDNTGWSARTRAVANYLQVLFEKEAQYGKNISVDGLLAGKSRKEAARMFFETLVLKTKDYIQVEQQIPFGDIRINPQGKLLKSEF